ncbi:YvrJ family protein [Alkalibacillus salilacus]|uniref:YvrJ family protein n=1 Tax=Alkalibacillus salilacus TaxID=284582 RepID=A0ABT9VBS7_9BACI|nr:YvrJ family protein [Alkalibacillus salilacus]MDQ0158412.1 hypothetical protein [Alkalibacillus salilacus]
MNVTLLYDLIGNFGFPIAITIYLLIRLEQKLSELTSAIKTLIENVKSRL